MALLAITRGDGYQYMSEITTLSKEQELESKERFEFYKAGGIIQNCEYDSPTWWISDEVHRPSGVNFSINEVHFYSTTKEKLQCSCSDYQRAMRVVMTSNLGFSISTLSSYARCMTMYANTLEIPQEAGLAQVLLDCLALLPGYSEERERIINKLEDIVLAVRKSEHKQRPLAQYQSYLKFSFFLEEFWRIASDKEKLAYFPVYFWWFVTTILPLRPTECVLTPRNCISRDSQGRYFLTIRRSKLKGSRQGVQYSIEKDYECATYPIPDALAKEILNYIDATAEDYQSDIDVLFSKRMQFKTLGIAMGCDDHYSYGNLSQCLWHYYRNVLWDRFGLVCVPGDVILGDNEIATISLGDARHIAMVSLMVSGGSASTCKALAGHTRIETSAHYYSNMKSFLEAMSYAVFRPDTPRLEKVRLPSLDSATKVTGGLCCSPAYKAGCYSDCAESVNANGELGDCKVCRYYIPSAVPTKKKQVDEELNQLTCLLRHVLLDIQDVENYEPLSCLLDRLRATGEQYIRLSAIERMIREEMEVGENIGKE